jgi:hypothetical protein
MASDWPRLNYEDWSETCDTLHAYTQVLGKLAVALAPPEPELQHAALCLSARGWETEVPWSVPLDADEVHATYVPEQVSTYFSAATQAALVLAALRAPYRGRSTPVNSWWGSFDLAVNLFSGAPAASPSDDFITRNAMDVQEIAVGWWPGDQRYGKAQTRTRRRSRSPVRPSATPVWWRVGFRADGQPRGDAAARALSTKHVDTRDPSGPKALARE